MANKIVQIKAIPEDFIVDELPLDYELKESGNFAYFWMKKKDYTTIDGLNAISRAIRIELKFFGYAGNKDKIAVTRQLCSVKGAKKDMLETVKIPGIEISFAGFSNEPISTARLKGNSFRIVVRKLTEKPEKRINFLNFYGEQRFSSSNISIGRALVKRQWDRAVAMIAAENKDVARYLEEKPGDNISALRKLPRQLLKLFVQSYQAWIWNTVAKQHSNEHEIPVSLKLVGFDSIVTDKFEKTLLAAEGVEPKDFLFREIPEISCESSDRQLLLEATAMEISELEEDELNKGFFKSTITFTLPKGSYATEVIKQLFQYAKY